MRARLDKEEKDFSGVLSTAKTAVMRKNLVQGFQSQM